MLVHLATVNGQSKRVDQSLWSAAVNAVRSQGDGRISARDARHIFELVSQDSVLTDLEVSTLDLIKQHFRWTPEGTQIFDRLMRQALREHRIIRSEKSDNAQAGMAIPKRVMPTAVTAAAAPMAAKVAAVPTAARIASSSLALHDDHFDPATNPIGPGTLQVSYINGTMSVMQARLYGQVLQQQPLLNLPGIDWSAQVNVPAYQEQMKEQAAYFASQVMPAFVTGVTDLSNFIALVRAGFGGPARLTTPSLEMQAIASNLAQLAQTYTAKQYTSYNRLIATANALSQIETRYNLELQNAIAELSAEAVSLTKTIAQLQVEFSKTLDLAMSEAWKLGTGIEALIVTTAKPLVPTSKTGGDEAGAETDAKPKPADSGGEAAGVDLTYITAASDGVASSSQAFATLRKLTDEIAAATSQLASINAEVALASYVYHQTALFSQAFAQHKADAYKIYTGWEGVQQGFAKFASQVGSESDPSLSVQATGAYQLWGFLTSDVANMRRQLVS